MPLYRKERVVRRASAKTAERRTLISEGRQRGRENFICLNNRHIVQLYRFLVRCRNQRCLSITNIDCNSLTLRFSISNDLSRNCYLYYVLATPSPFRHHSCCKYSYIMVSTQMCIAEHPSWMYSINNNTYACNST